MSSWLAIWLQSRTNTNSSKQFSQWFLSFPVFFTWQFSEHLPFYVVFNTELLKLEAIYLSALLLGWRSLKLFFPPGGSRRPKVFLWMSAYCTGHWLFPPGSLEGTYMHLDILQIKESWCSSGIARNQFSQHRGQRNQSTLGGRKEKPTNKQNPTRNKNGSFSQRQRKKRFSKERFLSSIFTSWILYVCFYLSFSCQIDLAC